MENIDAQIEALLPVLIATLLAAVPGLDRERRQRPAGLRTHMIVAMASALITVTSRMVFTPDSAARVVANVITGIGFLGAGVIIQRKQYVFDVTTAASIWMVALMGIVVGYEQFVLAAGSTFILFLILDVVRRFERKERRQIPQPLQKNEGDTRVGVFEDDATF